nr:hypothetical protein [Dechloromonas sp.]
MEIVFLWILFGIVTALAAHGRGRGTVTWFILGLLLGPLALVAVLVMQNRKHLPTPKTHVKCPDCREFVLKDARVCKHCGCKLVPQPE